MSVETLVQKLQQRWGEVVGPEPSVRGDLCLTVPADALPEIGLFLRDDGAARFGSLMDICGIDYGLARPRFHVVYNLYSIALNHRLLLRVKLEEGTLTVPTVTTVWKAADWMEREVWDMFGVVFEGHPNLTRLMMHEEFIGHPLRKDYPIEKRQVLPMPKEKL